MTACTSSLGSFYDEVLRELIAAMGAALFFGNLYALVRRRRDADRIARHAPSRAAAPAARCARQAKPGGEARARAGAGRSHRRVHGARLRRDDRGHRVAVDVSRYHVETTAVAAAPIDVVWARVRRHHHVVAVGSVGRDRRCERDGVPAPDGVGALRRFRRGRRVHTEEVVAFDAPRRLAYEVREGLPVRDYHAEVTLEPVGGGTRIRWVSDFDGANPIGGWVTYQVLRAVLPRHRAPTRARRPRADACGASS